MCGPHGLLRQQRPGRRHLQHQPVRIARDGRETEVPVEISRIITEGVDHYQPPTAGVGGASGSAERVDQHLPAIPATAKITVERKPAEQVRRDGTVSRRLATGQRITGDLGRRE